MLISELNSARALLFLLYSVALLISLIVPFVRLSVGRTEVTKVLSTLLVVSELRLYWFYQLR